MRKCGGSGRSGKSASILDFIENYWDEIDKDFATRGFDPYDWLRGRRPWDQFYNYCKMFSDREGSYLQAAQVLDDRHLAEWEQRFEEIMRSHKTHRPPLAGFDAFLSEMRGLRNDIRAANGMSPLDGPESPMDRIKDRKKALSNARLDELGL